VTSLSRAFLAVFPPAGVVDAMAERLRAVPPVDGLRWMPPAQWHVTLRFCGRVPDADALARAVRASCAEVAPMGGLQLSGGGAFPKARHGSALWLGVVPGPSADALGALAAAVEAGCVDAGLAPDDRPFRPHLTVARCSRAADLRPVVAAVGEDAIGPPWTVDHVCLMASDTRATGAVHTEVARIPLTG